MLQFFKKIASSITGNKPDWDELEADLIQADLGARFAVTLTDKLRSEASLFDSTTATELARQEIRRIFGDAANPAPVRLAGPPHVILMVGVNGVGKTTSAAKLAHYYQRQGKKVRLAAADTFRAAAVEQLQLWGERLGIPVTASDYGSDPAAVAYRSVEEGRKEGADVVIIDTAGRQHAKSNLMQELAKVSRVLKKLDEKLPHETLIVVDANTGANALAQAKAFSACTPLTGVIASKMDGSGSGGSLVAIRQECGLPTLWTGTGEDVKSLQPFSLDFYFTKLFPET